MTDVLAMEFEPINDHLFRQSLGRFPSGVTVITARHEGEVRGMTCSAFLSVSLRPPLVLVSVGNHTHMHAVLKAAGAFGISILAHDQAHWSQHFAGRPYHEPPTFREFADMAWVDGASVQFLLRKYTEVKAGDHTLFIGEITHVRYDADSSPLVFHAGRYGEVSEPH